MDAYSASFYKLTRPGEEGIEPSADDFGDHRSTAELFPYMPGKTRTLNFRIRSPTLYPVELQAYL